MIIKQQVATAGIGEQEKRMVAIMESCPTKCAFSFVGGFGMGAIFGLFTASVDPMYTINPQQVPSMKQVAKEMGTRAYSTGKNFALLGVMFSAFECNIESYRGKLANSKVQIHPLKSSSLKFGKIFNFNRFLLAIYHFVEESKGIVLIYEFYS